MYMNDQKEPCLKQTFGERMRYFMKKNGVTFAYLDYGCGLTESKLCQIAKGGKNIKLDTADKIIKAFPLSSEEFFGKLPSDESAE